jgi:hypothetical protein
MGFAGCALEKVLHSRRVLAVGSRSFPYAGWLSSEQQHDLLLAVRQTYPIGEEHNQVPRGGGVATRTFR